MVGLFHLTANAADKATLADFVASPDASRITTPTRMELLQSELATSLASQLEGKSTVVTHYIFQAMRGANAALIAALGDPGS